MTAAEKAVAWAINIANDDSHGYDQTNRWGPNYDCSSLVISAYEHAGVPVKSNGATYTGNMRNVFKRCGFHEVSGALKAGDVLLNEKNHAAMYIGGGQIVQASINERGGITGGQSGDQTRREIAVGAYYNYPWDCILRYEGDGQTQDGGEDTHDAPTALPVLAKGDVSGAVLSAQILLIYKWRISCGIDGADGDFGPNTESAVKAFQSHYGLDADGVIGPMTWHKLIN